MSAGLTGLLPHHRALLDASAIDPDVAVQRGYRSIVDPAELLALGFADFQCIAPTLLIPSADAFGQNGFCQHRPDEPRRDTRGKVVKYETKAGDRLHLDVPASVYPHLGNPSVDLFITEGRRKVDSLLSAGVFAIGLNGVYGWRGRTQHGGKALLADWEAVALDGRTCYLAFDSDVATNPNVRTAVDRLAAVLRAKGARVRFMVLPHKPDGTKMGVDDFLGAGYSADDFMALVIDVLPDAGALPTYPTDAFPPVVARFIAEAALALNGAPDEMIGLPLLAFAAAAIGNTRALHVKRGWQERPILWAGLVAPPGTAKTPGSMRLAPRSTRCKGPPAWRGRRTWRGSSRTTRTGSPWQPKTAPASPSQPRRSCSTS